MEDIFEICKILVLKYGRNMEYKDPYECGLCITYQDITLGAASRKRIRVCFGKREVYFHDKYTGEIYYCNDRNCSSWEKLVKHLFDYHQYNNANPKKALIRACKKEVETNDLILGKYTLGCGGLVKDQGVLSKTPYGTSRYTYESRRLDGSIKIALNRDSGYHLFVWHNSHDVFSYTWGEGKTSRGRYTPGEWEDDLYDIIEEVLSKSA